MITGIPGDQEIRGLDANGDHIAFRLQESRVVEGPDGEVIAKFHTYECFHEGQQVHAMRLGIVDELDRHVWVDMVPSHYEYIAEWLFKQASQLRAGEYA